MIKRLFCFLLTLLLLIIVAFPVSAQKDLYIDNIEVYNGMNTSYGNGYSPSIVGDEVRIVLPLKGGSGDTLTVKPDLGDSSYSPFIFRNYSFVVKRNNDGVFIIDMKLKLLDIRKEGVYPVHFAVETSEGNSSIFTVYVTVQGKQCLYDWIEEHSTLINIIIKALCWLIGLISAGALYYFNSYKKKKAAALFGFYTHYDMLLSVLEEQLKGCEEKKNPYTLLYSDSARRSLNLLYPGGSKEKTIEKFKPISLQLKNLLLSTENNVYPKLMKKGEWYKNTSVILNFSMMITDGINNHTIDQANNDYSEKKTSYKEKKEKLDLAIKALHDDMKNVKY